MKKMLILALMCLPFALRSQTAEQFKARYDNQVRSVGPGGVGVEYLLDQWSAAYPDDTRMLEGKFSCYLEKARSEEIQIIPSERYLGRKPVLTLKDSLGRNVNYYQVPVFNDSLFRMSQSSIDKAIVLSPENLKFRLEKISALASYEKDSPDMAATAVLDLVDYDAGRRPAWTFDGAAVSRADFESAIQEFCVLFYRTGSPNSYEAFRILSERMMKANPKNTLFVDNLGTYWLIARRDFKKAGKYYKKALKINPEDAVASANLDIIAKNKQK